MSVWIRNLLILLVMQLVLLAAFMFSSSSDVPVQPALLDLDKANVTSLAVADSDGNEVSVELKDGGWVLPSGLPASEKKVLDLLDRLLALNLSWPVSTSESTHERFEVADDKFQRRLKVTAGQDVTLWFGTSPGYQQIHARGDSDDVYAVRLATYEMPAKADDWLDKGLLQAQGEVTQVRWDDGPLLVRAEQGWTLGAEPASVEGAKTAVGRLTGLQVLGVLESAPTAAPSEAKEILVTDSVGEYRLSYWEREPNNDHALMSTRFPGEAFRVSNYSAEQLTPAATELAAPEVPEVDLSDVLPGEPTT